MLELPVKEVHLPDLHLPEGVSNLQWPTVDLSSVDLGKAMAGAASAVRIGRRPPRSRWPLALSGLIVAVLTGWVLLTNEALRAQLARGSRAIRERISAIPSNRNGALAIEADDPIAFPAAETARIAPSPFGENVTTEGSGYPAGLGSDNGDGIPTFEVIGSRI